MAGLTVAQAAHRDGGDNFDAIRLLAASLVIFSHGFELTGARGLEPLFALTRQVYSGELGVYIFFSVSGYLVTLSFVREPNAARFAAKRVLRIVPALAACVLLLALVVGPLLTSAPMLSYFADARTWSFVSNIAFFNAADSLPGVFSGARANGPLWTLQHEVFCYLLVAVLGAARLLNAKVCAGACLSLAFCATFPALLDAGAAAGKLYQFSLLAPSFFAGAAAALLRDHIRLEARYAALAAAALCVCAALGALRQALPIAGGYLVLYAAYAPLGFTRRAGRFGDFSYGLYLWGWPVQQVAVERLGADTWLLNLAIAFPVTLILAIASWRLVEAPALLLKSRWLDRQRRRVRIPARFLSDFRSI